MVSKFVVAIYSSQLGELHECGLAALLYKIKTHGNLFCGLFSQIYEKLNQPSENFPATQHLELYNTLIGVVLQLFCWPMIPFHDMHALLSLDL